MLTNLYYHFFDRELRESVSANLTDNEIISILAVSLILADGVCYAPISNVYESYINFPKSFDMLKLLMNSGLVCLASSHPSVDNFLYSRQNLYQHDSSRYPMYFSKEFAPKIWTNDLVLLNNSTTEYLKKALKKDKIYIKEFDSNLLSQSNAKLKSVVNNNPNKAVTFSLFRDVNFLESKEGDELFKSEIRKKISENYAKRYLCVKENSHIITGIRPISYYDYIEENHFITNYNLTLNILRNAGIDINSINTFNLLFEIRLNAPKFEILHRNVNHLLLALSAVYGNVSQFPINSFNFYKKYKNISTSDDLIYNVLCYIEDITKHNSKLEEEINSMDIQETIAIVAVTQTEMKAICNVIKLKTGLIIKERVTDKIAYQEVLGLRKRVVILQSGMGMTGSDSVIIQLKNYIDVLTPSKIIMCGIAFGANPNKQNLGEILVSKQVWNYEPRKIFAKRTIPRGDKVTASSSLLQLYNLTAINFKGNVHFGLLASGEKLINSESELKKLKSDEPEIIGGDMEAAGIASVCNDQRIEWIVIKGICDWGSDKTDDFQEQAAKNASEFMVDGLMKLVY